jgi:hypothetical protein
VLLLGPRPQLRVVLCAQLLVAGAEVVDHHGAAHDDCRAAARRR